MDTVTCQGFRIVRHLTQVSENWDQQSTYLGFMVKGLRTPCDCQIRANSNLSNYHCWDLANSGFTGINYGRDGVIDLLDYVAHKNLQFVSPDFGIDRAIPVLEVINPLFPDFRLGESADQCANQCSSAVGARRELTASIVTRWNISSLCASNAHRCFHDCSFSIECQWSIEPILSSTTTAGSWYQVPLPEAYQQIQLVFTADSNIDVELS
eukprot:708460-Prymnesium_polylepis.1